jgi:hypothetical protein
MPQEPMLSVEDQAHLDTLMPKLAVIRDRVRGLVASFQTGLFLWGEGGTGKSFTVIDELNAMKADYLVHNSRMTGRGLLDALEKCPTSVHLIEDCESLLSDRLAWGVLRAALWSQCKKRPPEREITWTTFNQAKRFVFTGAIVMIANRCIDDLPELRAVKTRVTCLGLVVTFNELAALIRSLALRGFKYGGDELAPEECTIVAEFVIERMRMLSRPLDMRMYENGLRDFLQYKTGFSFTPWQDLIETRLKERTTLRERPADRRSREARIALAISQMSLPQEQKLKLWCEQSGMSARTYWRKLASLE